MIRLLALLPLLAANPVFAQDQHDPARAYEACLVGTYVLEVVDGSDDAFIIATDQCAYLAAAVPEDAYGDPEGEGSLGAAAVEESVIHLVDGVLAEALGNALQ